MTRRKVYKPTGIFNAYRKCLPEEPADKSVGLTKLVVWCNTHINVSGDTECLTLAISTSTS